MLLKFTEVIKSKDIRTKENLAIIEDVTGITDY